MYIMKFKLIALSLVAAFCVLLAAGCGENNSSSSEATGSTEATSTAVGTRSYEAFNAHFVCRTDINDYISGDAVDMDKLADATGNTKTSKANEWTSAANGIRVLIDLAEPKDGVITAITVSAAHRDGTKKTYKLTYTEEKPGTLYKFGDIKISENGIKIATYALENAATAPDNDPFAKLYPENKNDKGEYVVSDKQ